MPPNDITETDIGRYPMRTSTPWLVALVLAVTGCSSTPPEFVASKQHYAAVAEKCVTRDDTGRCTYTQPGEPERWELCLESKGNHECRDVPESTWTAARIGYRYTG